MKKEFDEFVEKLKHDLFMASNDWEIIDKIIDNLAAEYKKKTKSPSLAA